LASQFVRRGLVDEYQLMIHPVVLGAGTPFFPPLDAPIDLHLAETRAFASGVTFLRYERRGPAGH
jgi:dihydrofolate reductase